MDAVSSAVRLSPSSQSGGWYPVIRPDFSGNTAGITPPRYNLALWVKAKLSSSAIYFRPLLK
jgi:hypothetical protein